MMRKTLCVLSAVCVAFVSNEAGAQAIDFETLPGGSATVDQQLISDQYEVEFGVRFDLVDPVTLLSIGSPQIAKVGLPQTAFVGCGPDTPLDGQGVGSSFLSDDSAISNQAGTLLLTYTDPVAQAAGAILDIDRRPGGTYEEWTIEALDATQSVIESVVLTAPFGQSECGGTNGSGNGRAMGFFFDHASSDIHYILIRYTGTAGNIGLAFDNFTPTTIPPPPSVEATKPGGDACYGDSIAITAAPSLGMPGYNYQWQQSINGGAFSDIVGETSMIFYAPALHQEVDYRVVLTDAIFRQAISNPVMIVSNMRTRWVLSVETAVGSGVFSTVSNNLVPFEFDESLPTVYDWSQSEQFYHGAEPVLSLDRSHLFLTLAPGGQSVVVVHDSADPNTGGRTEMSAVFANATPSFVFKDDPSDTYRGEGTDHLETRHNWNAPNTDGWAAGPLTGGWSSTIEFTDGFTGSPTIDGLNEWYFQSADGMAYQLPLEEDHKVRISSQCACLADLNFSGDLNFFDVSLFLSAFANQDPVADFTFDGQFNFFDVSAFLQAFAAGCP